MPAKKSKETGVTRPKGLNPPGTTCPIHGNKNKRAAVDIPIELPVYVYYERHISDMADRPLLGYSAIVDCFTTGWEIAVKISHPQVRGGPRTLEVWAIDREGNRKKLFRQTIERMFPGDPPKTKPEEDDFSTIAQWFAGTDVDAKFEGWPTELGRKHAAEKAGEQRKRGAKAKPEPVVNAPGRVSGDDIIVDDDDGEIEWEE